MPSSPVDPVSRFWPKVQMGGPDECWVWTAGLTKGYGHFWDGDRGVYAHRWAYEDSFGRIPDGFVIDHLCREPRCVNPAHLEVVTQQENLLRGETTLNARMAAVTHCPAGHEYTPASTSWVGGKWRRCRICINARQRAYNRRLREAG